MTMKKTLHKIRSFFCFFSGEDAFIIGLCDKKTQKYFTLIGLFVSVIFVFCFWSCFLFVSNLFLNELLGIAISSIVALIFTNLYLLILYTVSPPLLPAKKQVVAKNGKVKYINEHLSIKSRFIGFSLLLRLGLLLLIALFIVQPFNVWFFSDAPDHGKYAIEIKTVLNQNKFTWLTNFASCLIFILPVYLKYFIRNIGGFYEIKQKIEHDLIKTHYSEFKKSYSLILSNKIKKYHQIIWMSLMPHLTKLEKIDKTKFNEMYKEIESELIEETVAKYEYWADPPFRTMAKQTTIIYSSEDDFLKTIYPESN